MDRNIQNCMCKSLRASGLPQAQAHQILNTVAKWEKNNGVEWTVERIKSLHHWYISRLAGTPNIPSWVAHRGGTPRGPFKCVFLMKNKQKALAILSIHTAYFHNQISSKQWNKVRSALGTKEVRRIPGWKVHYMKVKYPSYIPKLEYTSPTFTCLTGVSIPVGSKRRHLGKHANVHDVAQAYCESWKTVPKETVEFLRKDPANIFHTPAYTSLYDGCDTVGQLVCIQEASLKARWIANPNRISQHFLDPLKVEWKNWLSRLPTDSTDDQTSGVVWAQRKLREGKTLVGADLTSASDTLSLWPCLDLVHKYFCGTVIDSPNARYCWNSSERGKRYLEAVDHFSAISRGEWLAPDGMKFRWEAGQPLGTGPSFNLLGLTNNLIGLMAHEKSGLPDNWRDCYRVIGDDIVMRAEMFDEYSKMITKLGGVVNTDKTLVSNRAIEFAGMVITKDLSCLKRVKATGLSDNSFMTVMSLMGDQAKWLLRPRQKKVWNEFRYVPGFVTGGNYPLHSIGNETLVDRYHWYLKHVFAEKVKPDKQEMSREAFATALPLYLKEKGFDSMAVSLYMPADLFEGVQPSMTAHRSQVNRDPRLVNGLTTLESLEKILKQDRFMSFQEFKRVCSASFAGPEQSSPLTSEPTQTTSHSSMGRKSSIRK